MKKSVHIVGLDLVRFVAAYLVVLDHFSSFGWQFPSGAARGDAAAFPPLRFFGVVGPVGVEVFFLLSGFVIVASVKGATANQFILNRAIRVFPALWICGVIALVVRAAAGEPVSHLLQCLLRSATLSPIGPYIDGVVWTLIVEAVFYALIYLIISSKGRVKFETAAWVLGCLSSTFIGVLIALKIAAVSDPRFLHVVQDLGRFPFKVFLMRHGVFFALGMGIWATFENSFSMKRMLWLVTFFVVATVEVAIDRGGIVDTVAAVSLWWMGAAATVLSIVYATAIHDRTIRARRVFGEMGRFSYPLYLNHYAIGQVVVPAIVALGVTRLWAFVVAFLFVSITSYLVMRFPERYFQGRLRHTFGTYLGQRGARDKIVLEANRLGPAIGATKTVGGMQSAACVKAGQEGWRATSRHAGI